MRGRSDCESYYLANEQLIINHQPMSVPRIGLHLKTWYVQDLQNGLQYDLRQVAELRWKDKTALFPHISEGPEAFFPFFLFFLELQLSPSSGLWLECRFKALTYLLVFPFKSHVHVSSYSVVKILLLTNDSQICARSQFMSMNKNLKNTIDQEDKN